MFGWALAFLIIALGGALLGFTGIAAGAASIAKIVVLIALVAVVVGSFVAVKRQRIGRR